MKRKTLTGPTLIFALALFMIFSGCNSGTGNQSNTDFVDPDPIAMSELIQGVFELLPPYQGYSIYLDGHFLVFYELSESAVISAGGKYEISGDTINDIFLNTTDPNLIETKWVAEMLEGDTIKGTMFNVDGSVQGVFRAVKKVNPTEEIRSQMKGFEGFYQYVPPSMGLSTMLGGYYIYLAGQSEDYMDAMAGTYEYNNDTVTCIREFAIDPQIKGTTLTWVSESVKGDTLTHVVINDEKEAMGRGQSVRPE